MQGNGGDVMDKNRFKEIGRAVQNSLGLNKHSRYVREHFFAANMKASIYMSVVVIVLEVWMIIRLTITVVKNDLTAQLPHLFEKYYSNYFMLLGAGTAMLIYAVRYNLGKRDKKWLGLTIKWVFSFICIYFGITISAQDYAKGEQILTFLTMELFVVCLLIWRPVTGFLVLTSSYLYFFYKIDNMPAFNTGTSGLTVATQINGFTMWLSTMMFCIANYNKTMSQAIKDENLEKMNSHLSRISMEDELTGINNMVFFRQEAQKQMEAAALGEKAVYLFFDIENFKSYNQKYGFHMGNELLKNWAHILVEAFPDSLVARFSDDHFVVLTCDDDLEAKAEALSRKVTQLQGEVSLQLKCGAYRPADVQCDPSLACDRARFACAEIKKHYNNSLRWYDKKLEDKLKLKHYIVNNFDNAIDNGYIKVYYQPVIDTATREVTGLEALARWQDPIHGLLPPGVFIDILEEYRQIHKLDICIVEQVCRDHRQAVDGGRTVVPVSLNFSRLDFELCDIVGILKDTAKRYDVPKEFLDVEITESALNDRQDLLNDAMAKLHGSGYKIWLDDFGSGYSSMNVLKDYEFDVLKIDMKFLAGFGENNKILPIMKNIVELTKQLNMVSLTEGVETEEQFEFLREIGCCRAQGYLFSRPVPKEQLSELVSKGVLTFSKAYGPENKSTK